MISFEFIRQLFRDKLSELLAVLSKRNQWQFPKLLCTEVFNISHVAWMENLSFVGMSVWLSGSIGHSNEVILHWADQYFFGLMTIRGYTITMCNQPLMPAQPPSLLPSVGDEMSTRQGHWQYSAALKVLQVWHRAGNASQAMWTVENMMPQVAHCDGWQRNKNIPGGPVKSPTFVSVSIKFHCVLMAFFN